MNEFVPARRYNESVSLVSPAAHEFSLVLSPCRSQKEKRPGCASSKGEFCLRETKYRLTCLIVATLVRYPPPTVTRSVSVPYWHQRGAPWILSRLYRGLSERTGCLRQSSHASSSSIVATLMAYPLPTGVIGGLDSSNGPTLVHACQLHV